MIYWIAFWLMRGVFRLTLRIRRRGVEHGGRPGGYLLACSHVSHLDPFCLSAVWPRKIGWMARIEFYRRPWAARLMRAVHAFPVNRRGVPVSAMKEALRRLERGEVVGVFPEGEIKTGEASVLRGGPIKRGVCLLAARSERSVLPCIVAGAEKFNAIEPWLPVLRGRLWVYCGDFVAP
ncbi:MAG: 1-acyl-sn-glycerol-3-phosphate acyltransferase, partial [Verrucomicrobiota bacterium]|nr:1-acyl-sn-glycerol-3-phosphate acyltransferase [Verrucomicrobiota bacterium]